MKCQKEGLWKDMHSMRNKIRIILIIKLLVLNQFFILSYRKKYGN